MHITTSVTTCGILETPRFGRKSNFLFIPGTKVTFECNQDFVLIGDPRRYCTPDGHWDYPEYGYTECLREYFLLNITQFLTKAENLCHSNCRRAICAILIYIPFNRLSKKLLYIVFVTPTKLYFTQLERYVVFAYKNRNSKNSNCVVDSIDLVSET